MDAALYTLLHVLVFVYWLGGDLGAFYASSILADPRQSAPGRAIAGKVLFNIDMAPRTALIMTLPTGLTLADGRGWIDLPGLWVAAVWLASLIWLAIAWAIHLRHLPPANPLRQLDLLIRWVVLAGGVGLAAAALTDAVELPLFLALKLLILAAAIGLGLLIRQMLGPFIPAFGALVTQGASEESDRVISGVLGQAKPVVVLLWILLITAAFLGLWQPQ